MARRLRRLLAAVTALAVLLAGTAIVAVIAQRSAARQRNEALSLRAADASRNLLLSQPRDAAAAAAPALAAGRRLLASGRGSTLRQRLPLPGQHTQGLQLSSPRVTGDQLTVLGPKAATWRLDSDLPRVIDETCAQPIDVGWDRYFAGTSPAAPVSGTRLAVVHHDSRLSR